MGAVQAGDARGSRAWSAVKAWVDPLVALVVLTLVLGLVLPVRGAGAVAVDRVATVAVVLLFFG